MMHKADPQYHPQQASTACVSMAFRPLYGFETPGTGTVAYTELKQAWRCCYRARTGPVMPGGQAAVPYIPPD
jgi:hypothetical protein